MFNIGDHVLCLFRFFCSISVVSFVWIWSSQSGWDRDWINIYFLWFFVLFKFVVLGSNFFQNSLLEVFVDIWNNFRNLITFGFYLIPIFMTGSEFIINDKASLCYLFLGPSPLLSKIGVEVQLSLTLIFVLLILLGVRYDSLMTNDDLLIWLLFKSIWCFNSVVLRINGIGPIGALR